MTSKDYEEQIKKDKEEEKKKRDKEFEEVNQQIVKDIPIYSS